MGQTQRYRRMEDQNPGLGLGRNQNFAKRGGPEPKVFKYV